MSRIAVISDVHANINALNLVFKDMEKRNVDKIVCLGDIVTKYFYPREVVDEIKNNCDIVLKGNCDDLVVKNENYKFARNQLGLDRIDYLDNLPSKEQMILGKTIVNLYHSNPKDLESMFNPLFNHNDETRYKDKTIKDFNEMFEDDKPQVSIVGHTHQSFMATCDNNKIKLVDNHILTDKDRAIINVGSVGEHSHLEKTNKGTYEPVIDPYITYLIIDENYRTEIIKIPYQDELKKVFFDSVNGQKNNEFPYSPIFTERMANTVKKNCDEETIKEVEAAIKENDEIHKVGR